MFGKARPTASPRITHTPDGLAYLHIWRTGRSYEQQKGSLYRREWTNVLFSTSAQPPDEPDIRYHDVRKPLPFADDTFEAAYALHIVEHLTPAEAASLLNELSRVLKPGGIVRISTPDLEDICRSYLQQLDECRATRSHRNIVRYRWAVYELLDQIVREESGGLMAQAAGRGDYDSEFVLKRFGDVFAEFAGNPTSAMDKRLLERLAALKPSSLVSRIRSRLWVATHRGRPNDPRASGEINKWMYDELSLEMLLAAGGFCDYRRQDYRSSLIPNWHRYALDASTRGPHAIEPSLYVEATKPFRS